MEKQISHNEFADKATELAKWGGEYALSKQHDIKIGTKGGDPRDLVTNIDTEIDVEIRKRISEVYPDHGFYSEESGVVREELNHSWAVDPIDGTSNYARGIPHYACCVSYLENNEVQAAAIYNPTTNECFTLKVGKAYLNDRELKVSNVRHLVDAGVIFTPGRKEEMREWAGESIKKLLQNAKKNRNYGSSALDLCFLASGRMDAVVYGTFCTLDVAGAIEMVRVAGGEVYNYDTKEPVEFVADSQRIIATSTPELLNEFIQQY